MTDSIRLAIRGFASGRRLVFEDRVEIHSRDLEQVVPKLAEEHGRKLAAHELHMVEIEFLDEPDQQQRFFRIGTDPSMMVRPVIKAPLREG